LVHCPWVNGTASGARVIQSDTMRFASQHAASTIIIVTANLDLSPCLADLQKGNQRVVLLTPADSPEALRSYAHSVVPWDWSTPQDDLDGLEGESEAETFSEDRVQDVEPEDMPVLVARRGKQAQFRLLIDVMQDLASRGQTKVPITDLETILRSPHSYGFANQPGISEFKKYWCQAVSANVVLTDGKGDRRKVMLALHDRPSVVPPGNLKLLVTTLRALRFHGEQEVQIGHLSRVLRGKDRDKHSPRKLIGHLRQASAAGIVSLRGIQCV